MLSLYQLRALQQTLSKSEKRYFRLQAGFQTGDKAYLTLFDWLDAQPADPTPAAIAADWLPAKLEPARKHLARTLLKSLRLFEADKDTDARLVALLHEARILLQRGLTGPGLAHLDRASTLAGQTGRNAYAAQAMRLSLQQAARDQFAGLSEDDLLARQHRIGEALRRDETLHQHTTLYELLRHRYLHNGPVRNITERTRLNDLLLEEYSIMNRYPDDSFESRRLHLQFQSVYFSMIGDYDSSLPLLMQLDGLFAENTALGRDAPTDYLYLLDSILTDLRNAGQRAGMPYFLDRFVNLTDGLALHSRYLALYHRLNYLADGGQLPEAAQLLTNDPATLLAGMAPLPAAFQARFRITAARVLRQVGQLGMALVLVNEVLTARAEQSGVAQYSQARLLAVMIHVDLDHHDYLEYELKSVVRKLRQGQQLYGVETATIRFVKSWLAGKPDPDFGQTLAGLFENPYERQVILALGLRQWAKHC